MIKRSLLIPSLLFAAFAFLGVMPANATMPPSFSLGDEVTVSKAMVPMTPWIAPDVVTAIAPDPIQIDFTRIRDTHADRSRTAWANRNVFQVTLTNYRTLKPDIPKRQNK